MPASCLTAIGHELQGPRKTRFTVDEKTGPKPSPALGKIHPLAVQPSQYQLP